MNHCVIIAYIPEDSLFHILLQYLMEHSVVDLHLYPVV